MFCFRKTSFVHPRSETYYALVLGYFGLKYLPDVLHCVYWVLAGIWAPDSSHRIGNKFFIHHCQDWKEGSFVWETVWFWSWANTHSVDLKFVAFCPKFSGDSYVEFQEKTSPGEFLRNFVQTKVILYRNFWNFTLLSEILFWICIALKKFTQVLSYVVSTQVRRHVHKKNQKRRYGGEKQGVLFSENQFCSPSVSDLLRLTPWVFWSEIFTRRSSPCLLSFGWDLSPGFVPQDWQ